VIRDQGSVVLLAIAAIVWAAWGAAPVAGNH
jgi:p-aminobenzoyl-glutamate transporter AbgT